MWDQLTIADVDRVKETLAARRAETLARHTEEINILEARQLGEVQSLNAKEAEIELLNSLIDKFKQEFMSELPISAESTATDQLRLTETTAQNDEPDGTDMPIDGTETTASPFSHTERTSAPAELQVLFPSTNFGRVQKIAS